MPHPLRVTLYGRPGCSLCDHAEQMLARIGRHIPLSLELVNIETDDALHQRYMFEIPVITAGGAEIAKAPIYEHSLRELLEDLARGAR
jgi:glutaredoxin